MVLTSRLKGKRFLTWITIGVFFFSGGMEYSVIFPTCWDYMHDIFGAEKWMYVLSISAMSISNLLVGPVVGVIYDRTHQAKLIVLFLNLFEIGGNLLYFTATSKYLVLASRFLTGIGWSGGTVIYSDIARNTIKRERSTLYSLYMSLRQLGILIGPAMNLLLRKANFNLGNFIVDKYTAPGVFMTAIWCVVEVMVLFMYFQLPPLGEYELQCENQTQTVEPPSALSKKSNNIQNSPHISERTPLMYNITINAKTMSLPNKQGNKLSLCTCNFHLKKKLKRFGWMASELIYEEPVILLSVLFFTLFDDWALQGNLVPMAESLLSWTDLEVSIFFAVQAGINILSLISVLFINQKTKLPDVYFITFGVIVELLSLICILTFFGGGLTTGRNVVWNVVEFTVSFALMYIALPYSWVVGTSLYSKILPMSIQGYGQGVRRSIESLAAIIGPLWAVSASNDNTNNYLFMTVPVALLSLILILLLFSFRKLRSVSS